MRWTDFKERLKANNVLKDKNYTDPSFVKELIEDYTSGTMDQHELYYCLDTLHVFGENLREYFNSVTLNSYDKDLLRSLSELNSSQRLDHKYFNYSDKGYLYRSRPFILLPIIKQELAEMLVVADDEEACLKFFARHSYNLEKAKLEGFSNGDWKEDIELFIAGWKETVKYLTYLTETCKSIIRYFEDDLLENPYSIRQFFFDYAFTFDFFVLVFVYETYIKYHDLDKDIANDISNHYKYLKPVMHEKLTYQAAYDTNDFDEKLNNPKSEAEAKREKEEAKNKERVKQEETIIVEEKAQAEDIETIEVEIIMEEEKVVEAQADDSIEAEIHEVHHEEPKKEVNDFDDFFDEVVEENINKPLNFTHLKEEQPDVYFSRHHYD